MIRYVFLIACLLLTTSCAQEKTEAKKTICLNMIVKDEKEVIERCLKSTLPLIDYWVIVDTGSSDGTQEIIKDFMKKNKVPGELHERPWINFSHNRNQALELAQGKSDYVLFIDADEYFQYDEDFSLPPLDLDYYYVDLKCRGSTWSKISLINTHKPWKWTGVLHEVIAPPPASTGATLQKIHNVYTTDGARSKDPKKYEKDAAILEAALKDDPNNSRYIFYLARSYDCANMYEAALKQYQRRAQMNTGFNDQEAFWSLLQIGVLHEKLQSPRHVVVDAYKKAAQANHSRAEPYYHLSNYLRSKKDFENAFKVAEIGSNIPLCREILFVQDWMYEYGCLLEYSVSAYWSGRYAECQQSSLQLLQRNLPENIRQTVEQNLGFANQKLLEKALEDFTPTTIGIFTYTNADAPPWDPDSIQSGITGSEEAVIYMSQKLADLGYKVFVLGNPPKNSKHSTPHANPRFVSTDFDGNFDIAISWRMPDIATKLRSRANSVYLWPHDTYDYALTEEMIDGFDDVFWLSKYQREQWTSVNPGFAKFTTIFANGINTEQFRPVEARKNPYSCIYASNYARGLEILLDIWPAVKEQYPQATLDIYYGWQHWGLLSREKENTMRSQIANLVALDVREHGLVGHDALNRAFEQTSLWTYPCTAPETFCITAIRAQLAGAMPVIINGTALHETVRFGYSCQDASEYLQTLLQAMQECETITVDDRVKMQSFIKAEYTWEIQAKRWKDLFEARSFAQKATQQKAA